MQCRMLPCLAVVALLGLSKATISQAADGSGNEVFRIASKDGTPIAVECAGTGPTLLIVHGGIGDRARWTPMLSLFSAHFRACAMDRRGHGESGDNPGDYGLHKEAEDVAAVVDAQAGPVFVLGHSYGGVAALEAAFLTRNIARLVLYEPPVMDRTGPETIAGIEDLVRRGRRADAVALFLRDVVKLSPGEIESMKTRPAWKAQVAGIDAHPRQMRALAAYRYDPERVATIAVPTLLLVGGNTRSPQLKAAIDSLAKSLPDARAAVLEGQEHNAMDPGGRQKLAEVVAGFLVAPPQ